MLRLATITVGLILFFAVGQAVVLVGAKATEGERDNDLFARYAEIMPGKSDSSLVGWCASYDQVNPETTTQLICHLKPIDEFFSSGTIYIRDHKIDSIWFNVAGLEVGDLAKRWGRPRIQSRGSSGCDLYWELGVYEIIGFLRDVNHFSFWLPVDFLAISPAGRQVN